MKTYMDVCFCMKTFVDVCLYVHEHCIHTSTHTQHLKCALLRRLKRP